MQSLAVYGIARRPHWKLTLWLGSLAALTAFNIGLWIWIARSASPRTPYVETQLLLSGVYVGVCGFRSLFPRVDLERMTFYFSIGVWTSLAMVLLERVASRA